MAVPVGIAGLGTYFPARIESAEEVAEISGIPEEILIEKMGIRQRHVAAPDEALTEMAAHAARKALAQADVSPEQIKMVISHGSEHKDHLVWVAAGRIAHRIGAVNAFGADVSVVCAGAPIAMNMARGWMQLDQTLDYVLLVAATREHEIINLRHQPSRFMFSFSDGAGAMLLHRGDPRNQILGVAAITDGSLAETVYLTEEAADGDEKPLVVGDLRGRLDVRDGEFMAERLKDVTLDNFVSVIQQAVEKGGYRLEDIAYLGSTHMKRSFWHALLDAIGLTPQQSFYAENYGHVQSADQVIALEHGLQAGKIRPGDLVVLTGAGAGYTWSAAAVRWG